MDKKHLILTQEQVSQKIKRLAYHIYERNPNEQDIIFAGIEENGYLLAQKVAEIFADISSTTPHLVSIKLNKLAVAQSEIQISCPTESLTDKSIVLFDDVMNTGKTVAYSLKPFLEVPIKKLEVLVLINRGHSKFPIFADYVGYELSTTINQHVRVVLEDDKYAVYLH